MSRTKTPPSNVESARASAAKAAGQLRRTGISTNLKVTLGILVTALVAVLVVVVINFQGGPHVGRAEVMRTDSNRLSTGATAPEVTVVEFLDFECGGCRAAYADIEKLRGEYRDRVAFVIRYFPLKIHPNAQNAAYAAEAAARQGKLEQMYKTLFDNQAAWAGKREPQTATFEKYAEGIGLDVDRFKKDVRSAEVRARVKTDVSDGTQLGLTGTPSFFVNGEPFAGKARYGPLKAAIDAALAK
ncbi:thioredoxin domain-containing protein [Actinoplanes sp. NPDC051861]|uniref:DsbA family protein n=1 Tax=Actinoplanes sp. NPDC051861 TaxID=3155170 RepID=UPI00341CBF85